MLVTAVLAVLVVGVALLGLATGTTHLSVAQALDALRGGEHATVVRDLRLPRVLCGVLVGAALGLAGSAFQSLSRNVLGSPDVIGVTTGAALGAVVSLVVLGTGATGAAVGALVGCVLVSGVTYVLTYGDRRDPGQRLVLVGIGVGAFCHGLIALLLTHSNPDAAVLGQVWLTGTLNARAWADVIPAGLGLVLAAPVLVVCARRLGVLEAGDDLARELGVDVAGTRRVAVLAGVGLTAMAVCSIGPVSFVALAAPHLARALTRTATVPMVPAAVTGALLLVGSDVVAQRLPEPLRVPVGIATGVLGGAYLVLVLTRRTR